MDYSAIVALATFIFGVLLTPVLKRWDDSLNTKNHVDNLFIEIDDCCSYLEDVIKNHFDFLHAIETKKDEKSYLKDKIPVPLVDRYDSQFIKVFYGEALKKLNPAQRITVRSIDNSLSDLVKNSDILVADIIDKNLYNVRMVRNILSKSCYLYYHLHRMKIEKERYVGNSSLSSFDSTMHVLNAFGYSSEVIKAANPIKTMLSREQVESLSENQANYIVRGDS